VAQTSEVVVVPIVFPIASPSLTIKTRRYKSYLTLRKLIDNLMVVLGCRASVRLGHHWIGGNWSEQWPDRRLSALKRAPGSGRSIKRRDSWAILGA
jgi:hypothetical protein